MSDEKMSEFNKWFKGKGFFYEELDIEYKGIRDAWSHQQNQIDALKEQLADANKVIVKAKWYLDADGSESPDDLYNPVIEYQQKWSDKK